MQFQRKFRTRDISRGATSTEGVVSEFTGGSKATRVHGDKLEKCCGSRRQYAPRPQGGTRVECSETPALPEAPGLQVHKENDG